MIVTYLLIEEEEGYVFFGDFCFLASIRTRKKRRKGKRRKKKKKKKKKKRKNTKKKKKWKSATN